MKEPNGRLRAMAMELLPYPTWKREKTIKLTYTNSKFSFGSYPADMFEGKVYWTETVAEK